MAQVKDLTQLTVADLWQEVKTDFWEEVNIESLRLVRRRWWPTFRPPGTSVTLTGPDTVMGTGHGTCLPVGACWRG